MGRGLKAKEKGKRAAGPPSSRAQNEAGAVFADVAKALSPSGDPHGGSGPAGSEGGCMARLPLPLRLSSSQRNRPGPGCSRYSFSRARPKGKKRICRSASKLALCSGGLDSSPGSPTSCTNHFKSARLVPLPVNYKLPALTTTTTSQAIGQVHGKESQGAH